ncbi:MAG: helix-turn-helix domain-containing protein [Eubacteriales bacterium]|nr:helix-turn-helix domain-containing protein [Eubacteriales bacterium]
MYIEKRYIRRIAKVFEELSAPVRLLDAAGACVVPEEGQGLAIPATLQTPGINHPAGDQLLRALDMNPPMYLATPLVAQGAEDLLKLTDAMLMSLFKSSLSVSGYSDVYRRTLKQELSGAELIARATEHQIPLEMLRTVLLFQLDHTDKASAYSILGELLPLCETDVLVEINRHTVALVKDMEGVDGLEELTQYALAVRETLMEEALQKALIGIGDMKHTFAQLGESYAEAKRAVDVGFLFDPDESIFVFNRLMLERFLVNTPREESLHYHSLLFNRKTAKLFNEEMLQTIDMFFRKDLNLSDTARQLFIHRNTLVYRLDKVQRLTGLDLRRFSDAVTFQILYKLKKCGQEKPTEIL